MVVPGTFAVSRPPIEGGFLSKIVEKSTRYVTSGSERCLAPLGREVGEERCNVGSPPTSRAEEVLALRSRADSSSPLEPRIGFSRAVRVDDHAWVAGTAPIGHDGTTVAPGDVAAQTDRCLEIGLRALADVGMSADTVVRTRVMLTDISHWREAAAVHANRFGDIRPACTFVEVSRFVDPDWLVEIELDAAQTRS